MGMLSQKEYLTGQNGLVKPGDTFTVLDAGMGGMVTINGRTQQECWLRIQRAQDGGESHVAYTTGTAIVGQVQRIDGEDRQRMQAGQFVVRLGTIDTGKGNPAMVLEDPSQPARVAQNESGLPGF